jgi:hypothetical protein
VLENLVLLILSVRQRMGFLSRFDKSKGSESF